MEDTLLTLDADTLRKLAALPEERVREILQLVRTMPEEGTVKWADVPY